MDSRDQKLTRIYEIAVAADWQGFASTPQKFNRFCVSILEVVDIDRDVRSQPPAADAVAFSDTCCGKCTGPCYVDQMTGA